MRPFILVLFFSMALAGNLYAEEKKHEAKYEAPAEQNQCIGAGPQSPRDIDSKAAAYSTYVEDGSNSGSACKEPTAGRLSEKHAEYNGCGGIAEGDTIEVHWVYTSCDINTHGVKPMGAGLCA